MTPQEVLESTTPDVREVINQILTIEKENRHFQDLASNKPKEAMIIDAIVKIISQGVK